MAKLRKPKKTLTSQTVGPSVQKYSHREKKPVGSSMQARKMSSKLKLAVGFSAVALSIAIAAVAQNTVLKGKVLKELEVKPNASLIDKYGDAANDPTVADALRKAQGQQTTDQLKETSNTYEALQNGTWKPGADPTTALMYGYVPPNMSPEQAQMLYKHLPHLSKMPRPMSAEEMAGEREVQMPMAAEPMSPYIPYPESLHTREPKARQLQMIPQQMLPGQMAGMPGMPNVPGMPMMGFGSGMGPGLSREEIAAQNQKIAEECIRARFGPVNAPTLQPGHNWLADQARKNAASKHVTESDHQSVVGVCDASGNEITGIQYDPWGNQTVLHGGTVMPAFGYKGMYYLPRANLYLTLYRPYSPALGRFLTRDPLGEAAGTNLYRYVNNNPISLSDPLGLFVTINYSEKTGVLSAVDSDTGQSLVVNSGVFSGDPVGGPATPGQYAILPEDFVPTAGGRSLTPVYALAQINNLMRLSTTYANGRSGFEIHPGTISHGCVTFKHQPGSPVYPYNSDFNKLENMLNNTSTIPFHGLGQPTVDVPGMINITP